MGESRFVRTVLFLLLSASLMSSLHAQYRAGIQGTITDTSGGSVGNAKITLTSQETGRIWTVTTGTDGVYRFSELGPGNYVLTVEAAGFKKEVRKDVHVRAEQEEGVNVTVTPGDVAESVTVSAGELPSLDTEQANIGRTISQQEIQRLPQLNRDPYELVRLAPGIFGDGARDGGGKSVGLPNTTGPGGSNQSIFQTENQVAISANGQRLSDNNFMIDGVSVNSLSWGGAAVVTPNQESVKEITVVSEGYSAEYGRNSGAQIMVVSKNGTNQLHGSGFFKYNDPNLNAYNRYGGVNGAPAVRVENRFRQYGASLGGPILKNKLFFFFSYEGLTNSSDTPFTAWLETPQYRQAVIAARPSSVTGQVMQAAGVAPRIISVLNAPCPGGFAPGTCNQVSGGLDIGSITGASRTYTGGTGGGLDGTPDIQFAQLHDPTSSRGNQFNFRGDWERSNDRVSFSFYITPQHTLAADTGSGARPMADLSNDPLNSAYTISYSRTISPAILNEARFNVTRFAYNQITNTDVNWGIPRIEVEGLPFDRIRFGAPWAESTPGAFAQNTYEFRDTATFVHGKHTMRAGVELRAEQNNNNLAGGARPLYSFTGLFNLANDAPVFEQINADPNTGAPANAQRHLRSDLYGLFFQDDIKVSSRLTVNLGVRWEYDTPLRDAHDQLSNLILGTGANVLTQAAVRQDNPLYTRDRNNFAPRVGFAYKITDKLVARGGYGIFFDRIPEAVFDNTHGNPPFFARYGICCGTSGSPFANGQIQYALGAGNSVYGYPVNPALAIGIDPSTGAPQGPTHPTAPAVEIYMAQQQTPNPYVHVYSMDFEYQLPAKFVATAGYQGSAGHKQIRLVNLNYLYPNNSAFFAVYNPTPDVNSNFNAMLLGLRRSYANGLQMAMNYRWSKSIDENSYEGPGAVTNQTFPQNLRSERGPSDFDVRHFWNATVVYDLPFFRGRHGFLESAFGGFSINTVLSYHTGFPWTPVTGQSVSTPGGPSLSPTRPVAYFGGAGDDYSNAAFVTGSNFPGGGSKFFDITRGGAPGIGRNSFRGPNYFGNDFSIVKEIALGFAHLGEGTKAQLRVNLYNAFNKLNLQPIGFGSDQAHIESTNFGRSPGGLSGRVVELQARIQF